MENGNKYTVHEEAQLREFISRQHEKFVCTANSKGEPNIAIMGTPRLAENGDMEFEISDPVSVTLDNMKQNKAIVFMAYMPGQRARDYKGARIEAEITELLTEGEKIEAIRDKIRARHGDAKAAELLATVRCAIKKIRPIVDRGQQWNEEPFGNV